MGRAGAAALNDEFWRARVVDAPEPDPLLVAELDRGEAEVIALANAPRPCLVVINENRGGRVASGVYGTPRQRHCGLFVGAHRRGLLYDLRETLFRLKRDGCFHVDGVIEAACKAAGSA